MVRDRDNGYRAILDTLLGLAEVDTEVLVGITAESSPEVVQYAAINEFGGGTTPERSFLRRTVDEHQDEYEQDLIELVEEAIRPGFTSRQARLAQIDEDLNDLGRKAVEDVKDTILEVDDPPNAPSTVARKGFDDPLIDTTAMLNSIEYVIPDE